MAPKNAKKEDKTERKLPKWITMKEDIVISGISGIFPDSFDMNELAKNLYAGKNCVTGSFPRWPPGYLGLPKLLGTVPSDLTTFDSEFFDYNNPEETDCLDFQLRLILEKTHEAFMDAGVSPEEYNDTNIGYFLASSVDETNLLGFDLTRKTGALQLHVARTPSAFNIHGPTGNVDVACGSSLTALHQAMTALRTGECNAAIVASGNICVYPGTAMMFHDMSMTSQECKCKAFDASADGYARAEALGVILLQKKKDAKRVYCTIRHTKANADGYKQEGITFPKTPTQTKLIRDTYEEVGIDPLLVKYMESHATGTKAGDPVECKAMAEAMCITKNGRREGPLWVGALKSNIGHTEAASGIAAIAKVIISYENKCIPMNLHLNVLNPDIPSLHDGSLKPLTENMPFEGGIVSVNNFGFGGANAHAILESNDKEPTEESYIIANIIPRLVLICGRTQEAVKYIFDYIQSNRPKVTRDFLALLNETSRQSVKKQSFRGALILHQDGQNEPLIQIDKITEEKRPLYYVFTGMGAQWPGMGKTLMEIDIFSETIHSLSRVLQPYGVDLIKLLTSNDLAALLRPIGCFVSIAALQIAFVDLLRHLGITPDGFLGHSIGEMGCAYADGALSAEQTILSAYWRGKCTELNVTEKGLMVAVGLSWEEVHKLCPPGIVPACNNSSDSVTIAGLYQQTKAFMLKLREDNVFVKEVDSCGVPFHSPVMSKIASSLSSSLKSIGIKSKPRSSKWLSTSADDNTVADVQYYVDNLIKPVRFFEATKRIPKNAVIIELSPHSLFNSAIKSTLGSKSKFISSMRKNGNIDNFLQAIGQLYQSGYNPLIEKLYPTVEWPVPRGTPFISPLVMWNHTDKWYVPDYDQYCIEGEKIKKAFKIKLRDREHESLGGHIIEGRTLYPGTGYLFLAWKTLANNIGVKFDELPVQFEDVQFKRATIMPKDREINFDVLYFEATGAFEIVESGQVCVSGRISSPLSRNGDSLLQFQYILDEVLASDESNKLTLDSADVYKELRLRGYDYGPSFQGIQSATSDGRHGKVKWTGDWIAFADSMLQIGILSKENRIHSLPTTIEVLRCDPRIMNLSANEERIIDVAFDPKTNIGCAVGIELRGLQTTTAPRKVASDATIDKYIFVPHMEECAIDEITKSHLQEYIAACQIVANDIERKLGNALILPLDPNVDVDKFLKKDSTKFTLIKILDAIRNNFTSKSLYWPVVEQLIEANKKELTEDVLIDTSVRCPRFIQPLIDTAVDNYNERPYGVLEVNSGGTVLTPLITHLMLVNLYGLVYKSTLAHSDKDQITDENDCAVIEFNKDNMKIGTVGDEVKPSSQGLVVFRDISVCNISVNDIDPRPVLNPIFNSLDENGFLLAFLKYKELPFESLLVRDKIDYKKRVQDFINKALELGFIIINKKYDSLQTIAILFRKPNTRRVTKKIIQVSNNNFNWVDKYKKAQEDNKENHQIWLVTNEKHSGILGAINCLRREPYGDFIKCVLSEQLNGKRIPDEIFKYDLQQNVFRNGVWGQMRHIILETESFKLKPTQHAYVNVQNKGDLSSFAWFESPHKFWPLTRKSPQELLVNVFYAPLNFRDIMCATGRLSADAIPGGLNIEDGILGLEFAGKDENGNRVMGMIAGRGMATTVVVPDPDFLWPIPDNWSMLEASTVPCVYSTSYYALLIRAKLKPGEKVLIHAGSGGVGLSAISICLSMNCEVFTTVGTPDKRVFIKKQFPKLKDDHILNSRDIRFEAQILQMTNGHGVDVVLNSLSEEKLLATVRSLAPNGRFCEIGKFDLSINNPLDLSNLIQNKTFHGVLLDAFFDFEKIPPLLKAQKKQLQQFLADGIKSGVVKPLPTTVFEKEKVEEAFRYMSTGKHMGKVVLQVRNENSPPKEPLSVMAIPKTVIHPQKTIIITGGLGGFSLELAQWLAERGAKKMVLTSRSGPSKPYHYYAINRLKKMGVDIRIWKGQGCTLNEVQDVIKIASKVGPIGGIFHLAMIILDALIENQTVDHFERAANTKIVQCDLFDQLSRSSCPDLDYFVVFSSIVSGKGNAGQSNYGFGNSSCERIIESRRRDGFPGLAIQWGAIGDVGFVAEQMKTDKIAGTIVQRMPSCMAVLDRFLQTEHSIIGCRIRDEDKSKASGGSGNLMSQIAHILGVSDASKLDIKSRLIDLGMDSLMGVEIKLALERDYNTNLSTQEIRNLTIGDLQNLQKSNIQTGSEGSTKIDALTDDNIPVDAFFVPTEPSMHLNHVQTGKPLFLLPSFEEQFYFLQPLSTKIMRPVFGINWNEECNRTTNLQALGAKWLKVLEPIEPMAEYDIVGYAFGGVVAIEMAIQLQKRGRKVRNVILLDSSPQLIAAYSRELMVDCNDELANVGVISSLISKLTSLDVFETKRELSIINSAEEILKVAAQKLKDSGINVPEKKLIAMIEAFLVKISISVKCVFSDKYNGDVTLFKANQTNIVNPSNDILNESDYGLSKVINGKVNIIQCEGDHKQFIKNNLDLIAETINKIK